MSIQMTQLRILKPKSMIEKESLLKNKDLYTVVKNSETEIVYLTIIYKTIVQFILLLDNQGDIMFMLKPYLRKQLHLMQTIQTLLRILKLNYKTKKVLNSNQINLRFYLPVNNLKLEELYQTITFKRTQLFFYKWNKMVKS